MSRRGAFVVTGAGSGIGRAIAAKILKEGHAVFGLGRSLHKLQQASRELPGLAVAAADLANASDCKKVYEQIRVWLKTNNLPLMGLINNAGIFERVSFAGGDDEVWTRHFENNLFSAVRLTREFLPELKSGAPSSVLNISSTLGLRPIANTSAYSASKAAMINWTETLALEGAAIQVRANCICPGIIDTPMHSFPSDRQNETRKHADAAQPLGHIGQPEDIAEAAWFLLSEKSRWTTGAVLNVDGGINL